MIRTARHVTIPDIMQMRTFAPRTAAAAPLVDWWTVTGKTCVAAYQPKGAASYAASLSNLANPGTYDASEGTAPDWTSAGGWDFNGTDDYLKTGLYPYSAWSALVQFGDTPGSSGNYLFGEYKAGESYALAVYSTGNSGWCVFFNNSADVGGALNKTSGNIGMAYTINYLDGAPSGVGTSGYAGAATTEILIGQLGGLAGYWYDGKIYAVVVYSDTLTGGEMATVAAAMAAL